LAILGVIATFTIPKILSSFHRQDWNAKALEAAAMIADAYTAYKRDHLVSATTGMSDLIPYMNYVNIVNTGGINYSPGSGFIPCAGLYVCLQLHNGGILLSNTVTTFGGTNNLNGIYFYFDPDGQYTDGSTSKDNASVLLFLYYNGLIRSWETLQPGSMCSTGCGLGLYADPAAEPSWFHWN
jgi:type II secretory pathway pseudopilin PulG